MLTFILSLSSLAYLNLYYLYFTTLAIIVSILMSSELRTKCVLWGSFGAICLAAPMIVTVILAYRSGSYRVDHHPEQHAADLLYYIHPGRYQWLSNFTTSTEALASLSPSETGLYVGLSLCLGSLLLLVYQMKRGWNVTLNQNVMLLLAAFFFLCSFGPSLSVYSWFSTLPFFPSVPARFGFFAIFFLIAWFVMSLGKGFLLPRVLLAFIACFEFFPKMLSTSNIDLREPALISLHDKRDVQAIHDFSRNHYERLLHQLTHRRNITSAFIARQPTVPLKEYSNNRFLRAIRKGESVNRQELMDDWNRLQVDAVIVPVRAAAMSERLREISFQRVEDSSHSSKLMIYTASK